MSVACRTRSADPVPPPRRAQVIYKPFRFAHLSSLEEASLLASTFTALAGTFFLNSKGAHCVATLHCSALPCPAVLWRRERQRSNFSSAAHPSIPPCPLGAAVSNAGGVFITLMVVVVNVIVFSLFIRELVFEALRHGNRILQQSTSRKKQRSERGSAAERRKSAAREARGRRDSTERPIGGSGIAKARVLHPFCALRCSLRAVAVIATEAPCRERK